MRTFKKDYWGFIYLWYDKRRRWFCVGSHYGRIDDGYISTTGHLKAAYTKRPLDFKRRIIFWLTKPDSPALLMEEQRWLNMIKLTETWSGLNLRCGTVRYYNRKVFANGGAWNKGKTGAQTYKKVICEHCNGTFFEGMYAAWHGERCIQNPNITEESLAARKRKRRVKYPKWFADKINSLPPSVCFKCGKVANRGNINRWHNDQCGLQRSSIQRDKTNGRFASETSKCL